MLPKTLFFVAIPCLSATGNPTSILSQVCICTCNIASTSVTVLPVPGGPNRMYGVGRHWPLTIRETAALWRSFRFELYKISTFLIEPFSIERLTKTRKYIMWLKFVRDVTGFLSAGKSGAAALYFDGINVAINCVFSMFQREKGGFHVWI